MRDTQIAPAEIMGIAVAAAVSVGATIAGLARMDAPASVRRSASRAGSSVSGVVSEIPSLMDRARRQLQSVDMAPIREDATQRASHLRDDATVRATALRDDAAQRASHLIEQVGGKTTELVQALPPRDVVMQAVGERAAHLRDLATEAAHRGEATAQPAVSSALGAVREESVKAGRVAKSAGSDMLALTAWASIGAALVWFGVLSPAQRERVRSAIMRGVEEVTLMVQDFRGYDEDF